MEEPSEEPSPAAKIEQPVLPLEEPSPASRSKQPVAPSEEPSPVAKRKQPETSPAAEIEQPVPSLEEPSPAAKRKQPSEEPSPAAKTKQPETPQPQVKKARLHRPTRCHCGLYFCQKGDLQAELAKYECLDLLAMKEFRPLPPTSTPMTHSQRKQLAYRMRLESVLKIPDNLKGKTYQVHKFHWPVLLLKKGFSARTLLSPKTIAEIERDQELLYGTTNHALRNQKNKYGVVIGAPTLDASIISPMEKVEFAMFIQAPVATKDDVMAYIRSLTSSSSLRRQNRASVASAQAAVALAKKSIPTPVSADPVNNQSSSSTPGTVETANNITKNLHNLETNQDADAAVTNEATTSVVVNETINAVETQTAVGTDEPTPASADNTIPASENLNAGDTNEAAPAVADATTPAAPIPDPCEFIDIVPTAADIVAKLGSLLTHFKENGKSKDEFLKHPKVQIAWTTLAKVYQMYEPIPLPVRGHYLYLCECDKHAEISNRNTGKRWCPSCRKRNFRLKNQLANIDELSKVSSTVPISQLARPVLLQRMKNANKDRLSKDRIAKRLAKHFYKHRLEGGGDGGAVAESVSQTHHAAANNIHVPVQETELI